MENIFGKGSTWLENWKEVQENLSKQYEAWGESFQGKQGTPENTESAFQDWIKAQNDLSKQFLEIGQSIQENFTQSQKKVQEDTSNFMGFEVYQKIFQSWLEALGKLPNAGDFSKFQTLFEQNTNIFENLFKENLLGLWGKHQNLAEEFQKFFNMQAVWAPNLGEPYQKLVAEFTKVLNQFQLSPKGWGNAAMKEFFEEYEQKFSKYLAAQKLGINRERDAKVAQTIAAFIEHCKVHVDYMQILNETSTEANTKVSKKLSECVAEGKAITSFKELAALWTGENEATFQKMMRTPLYAKIQGEHLTTYCQYKKLSNELLEEALQETPFATKCDLDLAFKEIHTLKTELRHAKKERQRFANEVTQLQDELQSLKLGIKELLHAKEEQSLPAGTTKSKRTTRTPKTKK